LWRKRHKGRRIEISAHVVDLTLSEIYAARPGEAN